MVRAAQFATFIIVALSILLGIHVYLWYRLVRSPLLPPPWRTAATMGLAALAVFGVASIPISRLLPPNVARPIVVPIFVWMGLMLLLLVFLLGGEAVRLLAAGSSRLGLLLGHRAAPGPGLLLSRAIAAAAVLGACGAGAYAARMALAPPRVRTVTAELARLPRALDGTTIVQLTDVHLGPTLGRAFVEHLVERTNALAPDVVVITGDLVDESVPNLRDAVAPLAGLRARHGVYFVTGNHEYYAGVEPWLAELRRLGIRVLRNERVTLGEGAASFDLAGVDDYSSRGLAPGHGPDLERALAGHDPARTVVLLAHQPREIRRAAELGVDLQLSGHTHGGQIWPWNYLVYLQQPFVAGLAQVEGTVIYTSNGTGFWGPPMRLGAPAEIARIVLRAPGS